MASASTSKEKRVEPVFFLNSEVYQEAGKWLDTLEVCMAVCEVVSDDNYVEGAQRIGGLWRVYLTNLEARVQLLSTGISIRGCQIMLKDKNPFINAVGREDVDTTRVYARNIPLSYDNGEIEKALKSKGVQILSQVRYVRARTKEGKLTNFKTGDRFLDIVTPEEPLPKKIEMGIFTASVYHKEQKQSRTEIECGNCKESGHIRRECPNQPVCYDCSQPGHKRGSENCPETQRRLRDTGSHATLETLEELPDEEEEEEEGDVENDEEEDSSGDEDDDVKSVDAGQKDTAKATVNDSNLKSQEQAVAKSKQTLISRLWTTSGTSASPVNSPGTSPIHSPVSSPRTRKIQDRSPDENGGKEKKSKKKKNK